jgi:hypothetical protein
MLPISCDDRIIGVQGGYGSGGDCFFADVKMKKPAYFAGAIKFSALFLETPHAQHLTQQRERMAARRHSVKRIIS